MSETNLVEKIAGFVQRFVFIKDEQVYRLLALWVIQTHFYRDFEYIGYVFAHSPEPGSGKSRLLEVLDVLVENSSGLLCSPTQAVLFRTADGGTQLLDEVDSWTNEEALRAILNVGFHRNGKVKRMEKCEDGPYEPRSFSVYAPRAMAGIGLNILSATTRDRTFIIPMVKQTRAERREKFRLRNVGPEAAALKQEIASWVEQNSARVIDLYDRADFFYLCHLRDRTIDIVEPLAAILEAEFRETPELDARRIVLLEAVGLTRKNDGEEFLLDHKILRQLTGLSETEDPLVGSASELAAKCGYDPRPTQYEIAATLRRYGFKNRSIRAGESVRHRYELPRARLAEICTRFVCGDGQEG
jgi:hypothetical protein